MIRHELIPMDLQYFAMPIGHQFVQGSHQKPKKKSSKSKSSKKGKGGEKQSKSSSSDSSEGPSATERTSWENGVGLPF